MFFFTVGTVTNSIDFFANYLLNQLVWMINYFFLTLVLQHYCLKKQAIL